MRPHPLTNQVNEENQDREGHQEPGEALRPVVVREFTDYHCRASHRFPVEQPSRGPERSAQLLYRRMTA